MSLQIGPFWKSDLSRSVFPLARVVFEMSDHIQDVETKLKKTFSISFRFGDLDGNPAYRKARLLGVYLFQFLAPVFHFLLTIWSGPPEVNPGLVPSVLNSSPRASRCTLLFLWRGHLVNFGGIYLEPTRLKLHGLANFSLVKSVLYLHERPELRTLD